MRAYLSDIAANDTSEMLWRNIEASDPETQLLAIREAERIAAEAENPAQGSHATASEMRTIRSHQHGQRVYSLRAQLAEGLSAFLESE